MKIAVYSFVLGLIFCGFSYGQTALTGVPVNPGTLQAGFAVITPETGTGEGLSVSETFGEQIGPNLFQASVLASQLVTLTDVVISADPTGAVNTGLAIVNPNSSPATVTLTLGNQQGVAVATRTVTIGAHQQISRFATELFAGDSNFGQPVTGLLFISSDIPVGVVALAFSGGTFTSLPVAAQLSGINLSPAPITAPVTTTLNGVTVTGVTPAATFAPVTPTFNGVTTPPTLLPAPSVTQPTLTTPITGSASSLVMATGTVPAFATTPQGFSAAGTFIFPQLMPGVGGTGALLLPQIASGGGWVTQVTIANASQFTQMVRIDFFSEAGAPLFVPAGSTVSNVVIPPGGVVTLNF